MPDTPTEERPPYLSLTTFTSFLDRMGEGPIPPRIDRSALDKYSGATQSMLLTTLRNIGFVDEAGNVESSFREAATDEAARKAYLTEWARQYYADQLKLAEANATAGMLHESFARHGYSGSTLRKAVVFYLALVEYLGLPNSPHFRPPKQSGTPTARRRPRTVPTPTPQQPDVVAANTAPRGDTTVINIGDLATITITVDAQWMKLPVETITAMRSAIADLEALNTGEPNG